MLAAILVALLPAPVATGADSLPVVARLEREWLTLRTIDDQLRITGDLGATVSPRRVPAVSLRASGRRGIATVRGLLAAARRAPLSPGDSAAVAEIARESGPLARRLEAGSPEGARAPAQCDPLLTDAWRGAPLDSLTAHTSACYGDAARRILVDGDTLDRLSILGLLGRTDDSVRRRRLFLALEPVWRSVNGDDGAGSPFREMVRKRVAQWVPGDTPFERRVRGLGVAPDSLEAWLVRVLDGWRASQPDTLLEPWDYYYETGEASRILSPLVPRDSLRPLVTRWYRSLGADLDALRVHWDLDPRPGKYATSFTDFGSRLPVEPWIFTSYRIGGFDNLGELVHEAGHAVHIAAIRTRGAYTDWPDSDTFTEAIADIAALELNEPAWQSKFLGRTAPAAASLRSKYGGIVLDIAWALFEIRQHRSPGQSPNGIWTDITSRYLHIRPHPEWSWWAMRGQLVGSPFYMLNYAFGAILIADIRARLKLQHGSFTTGDPAWYPWVSARLYRFGRERSSERVVRDFLGRGVRPEAVLAELSPGR